jgi:arginine/lysine/ornithine decarboxylase
VLEDPVLATDAIGRVSVDAIAAYPPGIPNPLPGDLVTADTLEFLSRVVLLDETSNAAVGRPARVALAFER